MQDCRFQFKLLHPHCLVSSTTAASWEQEIKEEKEKENEEQVDGPESGKGNDGNKFTTSWIKIGRNKTTQRRTANSLEIACGGGREVRGGARVRCVSGVRSRPYQQRLIAEGQGLCVLSLPLPLLFAGGGGGGARAGGECFAL